MFKKLSVIFLSVCIAAAMYLGASISYPDDFEGASVTVCDMEPEKESF